MERKDLIESEISAELEGTGGGYGRYPGLTVAQIAERFRFLVAEGEGRSVRAILRIVHEQTDARGHLGTQPILAGLAALATAVLAVLRMVVGEEATRMLNLYFAVAAGMTLLFTVGALTVRPAARRNRAQVREIRRMALIALDAVTSKSDFQARPLEREHVAALESLKKTDRLAWQRVALALGVGS